MKKTIKTANISATLYDGEFDVVFECAGVGVCRFALCHIMPPDGSEECTFREYGSCRCPPAQYAAIESLCRKLSKELKQRSEA